MTVLIIRYPRKNPSGTCCIRYIYIALMNSSKETELDYILVGTDYTECDEATEQPGSTPKFHE